MLQHQPSDWPYLCSRRDANLFTRAVKKWGRVSKIDEIAQDVGGTFPSIPDSAK